MDFRIEFDPPAFQNKIDVHDRILMTGSCFTEHIYGYFSSYKFRCLQNPNGTLFNPISIFKAIASYAKNEKVEASSLFQQNGLWNHWDFHSSYSDTNANDTVSKMNASIDQAHHFLKQSNWLIITLGTSFVYENTQGAIVANCHKVPTAAFKKRLLTSNEIKEAFYQMYQEVKSIHPEMKIIFTISPVRHLRDGFVENNRSKAILLQVVGELVNEEDILYFPSYELIIDDLRDYRFYAEDMVHPNYQATKYVWEKFCASCIEGKTRELMKEIDQLNNAMKHKPMHRDSEEHQKFLLKFSKLSSDLSARFSTLDWSQELAYFSGI